jgi:general secretion pathway protein L
MSPTVLRHQLAAAGGSARRTLGQVLTWWTEELLGLLPERFKELTRQRESRLLVDVDGTGIMFSLSDAQGQRVLGELSGLPELDAVPAELDEVKKAYAAGTRQVAVRVPSERALRRMLTLPIAADRNLSAVIGFELDRYTPFKAEQAYYSFVVEGRDRAKGELRVALTVVARKEVDPLLERLRSWGLQPTSLELRDANQSLNLLPTARRESPSAFAVWRNAALAAIAAALLVAVIALPLVQKTEIETRLEQEVAAARAEALRAEQVRKELKQLVDEESAILDRRKQRPSGIQLLDEIARLLPDNAWLNRFELSDARVTIRGEAANASELVKLIESSGKFRNAAFEGALTHDARTDRERFTITATAIPVSKP